MQLSGAACCCVTDIKAELIVPGPGIVVYMYTDPTRLNRIALPFLPYRSFGLTGCLPAARILKLPYYGIPSRQRTQDTERYHRNVQRTGHNRARMVTRVLNGA
jgi:hypothetical protein